jgi:PAS domain S-box-containing protein
MKKARLKILAIDDNADNLTTLRAVMRDALADCTLLTASNGNQGIELALTENPDVILLDIVMPNMDGYEVCRRLKSDEQSRPIPVVFLTALRTDRDSRIKALDCGAEGFLCKPLDEQELIAEVLAMSKVKAATLMQRDEAIRLAGLVEERTHALHQSRESLLNMMEDMRVENDSRKRAEVMAQREEALSNIIIDSIPGTFFLIDENGRYARWNSYQRDVILGKANDQMTSQYAIDTIHPDDRALIQSRMANVLEYGKEEMVEGRVLLRGGPDFIWMLMTGRRLLIKGRPFLVGTGIDITSIKQADEAVIHLAKVKSKFTSVVSHELRSPLATIKEATNLVMEGVLGPVNEEQKDMLNTAKSNIDRLGRLVNKVLMYQKMDAGKMVYDFQENDVNEMIKEAHLNAILFAGERKADLVMNLMANPPTLKFDKDKIMQVLTNLISNGIKYSERGPVVIETRLGTREMQFSVRDAGQGVHAEELDEIFMPFSQGRGRKKGGTGLGLAISKEIVLAHHGRIWVESETGKGSTFYFTLPAKDTGKV